MQGNGGGPKAALGFSLACRDLKGQDSFNRSADLTAQGEGENMTPLKRLAGVALAAGALVAAVASNAQADAPVPLQITQQVDFREGGVNTFTATGPLCPSGTFVDEPHTFGGHPDTTSQLTILVRTVYTCDDGSGTFNAIKHVFATFTDEGSVNNGRITLHGGTGAYSQLSGHGTDIGTASGDFGMSEISGVIVRI
jgi:hypothetical protein